MHIYEHTFSFLKFTLNKEKEVKDTNYTFKRYSLRAACDSYKHDARELSVVFEQNVIIK